MLLSRRILLTTAACAAVSGCVATQRDILDLSQQTDTVNLQVRNLKKIMDSLQANQADLNVKLDELDKNVSILNENLRDNRDQMSQLSAKLDDLGAALSGKVAGLSRSIEESQELIKAVEQKRRAEAEEAEKRRKEEEARRAKEASAGPMPSQIYHSARTQLSQKKYDLAADGFALYLEKFPKGEVADLATYYLGQARFFQGRWEEAARQFALVLDRHPKSEVTPAARLLYAQSLMKMGTHLEEAKRYLESIPEDFPKSSEAVKARQLLKDWGAPQASSEKKPAPAPATKQ